VLDEFITIKRVTSPPERNKKKLNNFEDCRVLFVAEHYMNVVL
jgi:hypothetical protein